MLHLKPKKYLFVRLLSDEKIVLLACNSNNLPLKEKVILEKSIEFFNDSEPCFIHRSAVMVRLLSEISEILENKLKEGINLLEGSEDMSIIQNYVNVVNVKAVDFKIR